VVRLVVNGAGTIFGQGGQDRKRQSREREIKVFAGIIAYFVPEKKRSPKKINLNSNWSRWWKERQCKTVIDGGGCKPWLV